MSAISNFAYVTLVAQGGIAVRLADQFGASLPTTGNGSLVFSNGATLTNVTINGTVNTFPLGAPNGSVAAPSFYLGTPDRGLFSQNAADLSFAISGALVASFDTNSMQAFFQTNSLQIKQFSDTASEVAIQGYDLAGVVTKQLTLQKYGSNVAIGAATAPVAGGSSTNGQLSFSSDGVLLAVGTGAPTLSARNGSLYLRDDTSANPPYFNAGSGVTTTWQQLVGVSATQTLTNKTLTSPVINGSTTFSGQVINNLGAIVANTPFQIIETWNNGAINFTALQIAVTATAQADPSYGLQFLVGGSNRFSVDRVGNGVFAAVVSGTQFTSTGNHISQNATAIPAGGTQDAGYLFSSVAHFGVIFGSGAATASMARGSLYLRSDGLPAYNTNGTTGWDTLVGLAAANTFTGTDDFTGATISMATQAIGDNSTKGASTAYADRAGLANLVIRTQVFPATGTYTPDANMVYAIGRAWGGGAAGGGSAATAANAVSIGGGGGAGGYQTHTFNRAAALPNLAVTIGAAGTAGAVGNNAGGNGGDTSLGAILIAKGGTGGGGSSGAAAGASGAGGIAGTGNGEVGVGEAGDAGFVGTFAASSTPPPTRGGSTLLGGGGQSGTTATPVATAATGKGAGGGPGASASASAAAAGTAGTIGWLIVYEYCKA